MLEGKSLLVTGGTGSFGKKFVETIIAEHPDVRRLVIYSRDELKQYEMSQLFPVEKYPFLRYFIGDVRDAERLKRALFGIDMVVHAAALKQVPTAEYNPIEFVKTNVIGAENVITASIDCNIQVVIALSTDKAAAPINLYGATKLCADKLFVAANNLAGGRKTKFAVVRYGNVMGSRGSVIPYFLEKRKTGILPITHPRMTRFNITLKEAIELVLYAIENALGGEIFVPKIPTYRILDLAEAIAPGCKHQVIGIRPGEKIHEEMITSSDALSTVDLGRYYAILPNNERVNVDTYHKQYDSQPLPEGFSYNSGTNEIRLSADDLRELIKLHVDPSFSY